MMAAIELDCEPQLLAIEVENVWTDGMLSPEFATLQAAITQATPDAPLSTRELLAKITSAIAHVS